MKAGNAILSILCGMALTVGGALRRVDVPKSDFIRLVP